MPHAPHRARVVAGSLLASLALVLVVSARQAGRPSFDVVIAGGRIVDGLGSSWYRGDVGVAGDRIAAIGDLRDASAKSRIDATDLVVAPGFIDLLGQSEFNVLVDSRAASKTTRRRRLGRTSGTGRAAATA